MVEVLNVDELDKLQKFRLTVRETVHVLNTSMSDIVDEDAMHQYLKKLGDYIGSPNGKVTASIFIKRYAFLAVIFMYGITARNKMINTSLENTLIQTDSEDRLWLPQFYLLDQHVESLCENREDWREKAIKKLFSENINVVINKVAKVTKQSKLILWENIAIYLFWLYETNLLESEDLTIRNRAKEDCDYLFREAPGKLFGAYHNNPLKRYDNPKSFVEHIGETVRVRKTCCFSYLLEGSSKRCKTCPQTCNVRRSTNERTV